MQKLDAARYLHRFVDETVRQKLAYAGAVEIRGPKWCGKTQTALQHAGSAIMMQDPDKRADYMLLASTKPSVLLEGERPHLVDEWQDAPQIWDAVRFSVDQNGEAGMYLLTGSATPTAKPAHSGTGRIVSVDMLPMSLAESRDSTGEVSLAALFDGQDDVQGSSACDIERMSYLI
ncbi:MAG: AAA family ATPase, partial [Eggerthellaceae bacterium]